MTVTGGRLSSPCAHEETKALGKRPPRVRRGLQAGDLRRAQRRVEMC